MQIKCTVFKGDLFQYMCLGEKRKKIMEINVLLWSYCVGVIDTKIAAMAAQCGHEFEQKWAVEAIELATLHHRKIIPQNVAKKAENPVNLHRI